MADTQVSLFDTKTGTYLPLHLHDNEDGTYSFAVNDTISAGTDGVNAPSPVPSGGTGILGWLSSLVKLFVDGSARVNQRRTSRLDDEVATLPAQATSATLTSVAAAAITGVLITANAATVGVTTGRLGLIIVNDTTNPAAILRIAYAATASATAYTDLILPGDTWEMPAPIFAGAVSGIWDVAAGAARITELA
jgi:hypothetical protein